MPYAVATALCKGRFSLADLEDAARLDIEVLAFGSTHRVYSRRTIWFEAFSGGVKIKLKDGSELEHFEAVNRGAEGQLLSHDQVRDKFLDNCALTIPAEAAERLWHAMMTLDKLKARIRADCALARRGE